MNKYCDGITRRDFIRVGAVGGLSLASYLRQTQAAPVKSKSAIFVYLGGGPTHMDTFDLKPESPAEVRGEFNPISTKVAGLQICEYLPKLAAQADKYTIVRGITHSLAGHELGTEY